MIVLAARTAEDLEPQPRHTALLFDWDGTVADSQLANFLSLREALRGSGADLDQDWFDARTGVSTRDMVALVAAEQSRDLDVDAVAAHRDAAYLARAGDVREVALVAALLRREHGRRPTALATGGGAATVLPTARALDVLRFFDAVVTREDVELGKPAPDIFRRAAALLGVPAEQCLVYEDSDEGIEAAGAAGMDVVDVRPLRR